MIAAPAQLRWTLHDTDTRACFEDLPDEAQVTVLALLARLIERSVLAPEEDCDA